MHKSEFFLLLQRAGMGVSGIIRIARQHNLTAPVSNRIDLDGRRRRRHNDHRTTADFRRRERHPLRMVSGRSADDAAFALFRRQFGQLVVCAAQLERKYRLHVFAFDEHGIADTRREVGCRIEWCFYRDIVDLCIENFFEIIGSHDKDFFTTGNRAILTACLWTG